MSNRRTPRFVPSLVFASCVASVIPACGGTTREGADGGSGEGGGGGGGGYYGYGGFAALAIGGFSATYGAGGYYGAGGRYGPGGGVIVLAIAGFNGYGGFPGYGGAIPLALAGFANSGGTGGRRELDASPDGPVAGGAPNVDAGHDDVDSGTR